jgi:hypothetical protein
MLITVERAATTVGVLAPIARPTFQTLRAVKKVLRSSLQRLPAPHQSPNNGYAGILDTADEYALIDPTPWVVWPNPGPLPDTSGNPTRTVQSNRNIEHAANLEVYNSEQNVERAVIDALNAAIPDDYKSGGAAFSTGWPANMNVRAILTSMEATYGIPTPQDKAQYEKLWQAPWDTSRPIESMFRALEDAYSASIAAKVPYTLPQLIDKALTKIQVVGQYSVAIDDWAQSEETVDWIKNWPNLRHHFTSHYNTKLASGGGTMQQHGYVNMAADGDITDDDSVHTIQQSFANIHLANNAGFQSTQESLSLLTNETRAMRAEIDALRAERANYTRSAPPAAAIPTYVNTPPTYAPPAYTPYNPPTGQAAPAAYGRGRGRGGRGGRRGRGGRGSGAPAVGAPPTAVPGIPPPTYATAAAATPARAPYSNTVKMFANWNICYTCGWDVDEWHTSSTCPQDWRKVGHQEGLTRQNWDGYKAAGHWPSAKGKHKTQLPIA